MVFLVWVSRLRKVRMTPAGFGGEEREWVAAAEVHEPTRSEQAPSYSRGSSRCLYGSRTQDAPSRPPASHSSRRRRPSVSAARCMWMILCGNCPVNTLPESSTVNSLHSERAVKMITDNQLYTLAIFLGSASMLLIVLYHFLEVNSEDHVPEEKTKTPAGKVKA